MGEGRYEANADAAVVAVAVQVPVALEDYHYIAGTELDDSLLVGSLADVQHLCSDHSDSAAASAPTDCTRAR